MRAAIRKRVLVSAVVAWGAVLPAMAASGPSFDCRKAKGRIEEGLCRDPKLAELDRRMGGIYAELRRESEPDVHTVVSEQLAFLKDRDACTENEEDSAFSECLTFRYDERIRLMTVALPVWEKLRPPVAAATSRQVEGIFSFLTGEALDDITSSDNWEALNKISCAYFEHSPKKAAELFSPAFYSTRDSQSAICADLDLSRIVPGMKRLLTILEDIEGAGPIPDCTGTMGYGVERAHQVARLMAVVEGHPDFEAARRERKERDASESGFGYHPNLAHWAIQGRREKRLYASFEAEMPKAKSALAAEYGQRFNLNPAEAERLATYHVDRLVDSYTGRTGESSTNLYVSQCYGLADLRAYLGTGKLPARTCPEAEYAEPGAKAVLRRLLGLAIVNDASLADIKRLIAAGASLDAAPASFQYENRETPLMLAASRSDVFAALLAAGADPRPANAFGKTALMYAVQERDLSAIRSLLATTVDVNAATHAKVGIAQIEACGLHAGSRTALMYAAWQGNPEIVSLLLKAGADVRRVDSTGAAAGAYVGANRRVNLGEQQQMMDLLGAKPTGPRAALDGVGTSPVLAAKQP
jgi:uncharacterized protein